MAETTPQDRLSPNQRARFDALFKKDQAEMISGDGPLVLTIPAPAPSPEQVQELAIVAQEALLIVVDSPESYTAAIEKGRTITALRKKIEAHFKALRDPLNEAISINRAMEVEELNKFTPGEEYLKGIVTTYRVAQEKIQREAAEAERKRLHKEAEDKRLEAARQAEAAGKTALANALVSAPVPEPKVVEKQAVPHVAGTRKLARWTFEILDPALVPREFCSPDSALIRAKVVEEKEKATIPGVRIYQADNTSW